MVNVGMPWDRESLIQAGWPMERYGFVEYVASLDVFNFVDALTGKAYSWTPFAVTRGLEIFTESASIVECGICVDSTSDMAHG